MPIEREFLLQRVDALRELLAEYQGQIEAFGDEPLPGSDAGAELDSFQDPEFVQTALSQGVILSVVVRDHIESLLRALAEPALTMAPWACARTAIEAAALGCWLLERGIGAEERVSRSFAYRFKGLDEQRKFAEATGKPGEVTKAEKRIRNVASSAGALGLRVFEAKGKITGIGRRMPHSTELAESSLKCGTAYRLFSAMVHAHPWAFIQLGFERLQPSGGSGKNRAGVALFPFQKAMPPIGVTFLCLKSGNALHDITGSLLSYLGGDLSALDAPYQRFTRRLQQ